MNIFKFFTRGGRQDIVRELLEENLTTGMVNRLIAEKVTELLKRRLDAEGNKKALSIVGKAETVTEIVRSFCEAADDGEITQDEASTIVNAVAGLFGVSVAQVLDDAKDAILEKVP